MEERIVSGFVIYSSLVVIQGWVLGLTGYLRCGPAVLGSIITAFFAWFITRKIPQRPIEWNRPQSTTAILVVSAWLAAIAMIFSRAYINLAAPPLGHDSLMYHLHHPATWLQDGRISKIFVPLVQTAGVEYYPINGEILYAWWMMPVQNDDFAKLLQIFIHGMSFPLTVMAARSLGARKEWATIGSLPVFVVGQLFQNAGIANTDLMVGFFWTAAIVYFIRSLDRKDDVILAGLSLGMCVGTKTLGLILGGILGLLMVVAMALKRRPQFAIRLAVLLPPALVTGAPSYIWNWILTGNPVYPVEVGLGGRTLLNGPIPPVFFPSHEGVTQTLSFFVNDGPMSLSPASAVMLGLSVVVVCMSLLVRRERHGYNNFGIAFVAILTIAGIAAVTELVPRFGQSRKMIPIVMLATIFLPLCVNLFHRRPGVALTIAMVGMATNMFIHIPIQFWYTVVMLICISALGCWALYYIPHEWRFVAIAMSLVTINFQCARQLKLDRQWRYEVYEHVYGPNDIGGAWRWIDTETRRQQHASVIAYVSERPYPLLGAGWRNRTIYVPVTAGGQRHLHEFVDELPPHNDRHYYFLIDRTRFPGDQSAWIDRIKKSGANYLFCHTMERHLVNRDPPELKWAEGHPDLFTPVYRNAAVHIFRIRN